MSPRPSKKVLQKNAGQKNSATSPQSGVPNPTPKFRAPRSAFRVDVANRQRKLRVDRHQLARLARSVLQHEQIASAEISVAIVDDEQIHAINRDYLGHNYPTDVISFLLDEARPAAGRPARSKPRRRGAGKTIDGEIVISAETALRNAARYGLAPRRELDLYLVHGLLHLCGYDDLTPREKRLMRRREAEALGRL